MKALRTVPTRVTSKGLTDVIPAVQSDSGRSIDFVISDMALPSGATATFYALKPDKTIIFNPCTITGNVVTVDLTTQTLAVVGVVNCQVQIIYEDDIVTSFEFAIKVEKSLVDTEAIESTNEFGALTEALQTVSSLVTGVKGDGETDYRTGQINLTLANLGYGVANNYTTTADGYLLDARAAASLKSYIDSAVAGVTTSVSALTTSLANVDMGLTLASGFASAGANRAEYNQATKTAIINFTVSGTVPAATYTQICSITSGYAPTADTYTAASCGVDGWAQVWIDSSGVIQCWHPSGTSGVRGTLAYTLD